MSLASFRLDGLAALITGAGSGIGRAAAVGLAAAGAADLILVGRRADALQGTEAKIRAVAPKVSVHHISCDLTEPDELRRLVHRVQTFGRLDCLVNNAGMFTAAKLEQTTDKLWREHIELNCTAPLALIRLLYDQLKLSPTASVINISSTLAVKPIPATAAYNASKAALIQLTRSLALELGADGIRVNCVLPAIVETDMYRDRYATAAAYEAGLAEAAALHPLGRIGRPEDIANAIVFLASDAASWITGVALPVDGGMLVT